MGQEICSLSKQVLFKAWLEERREGARHVCVRMRLEKGREGGRGDGSVVGEFFPGGEQQRTLGVGRSSTTRIPIQELRVVWGHPIAMDALVVSLSRGSTTNAGRTKGCRKAFRSARMRGEGRSDVAAIVCSRLLPLSVGMRQRSRGQVRGVQSGRNPGRRVEGRG